MGVHPHMPPWALLEKRFRITKVMLCQLDYGFKERISARRLNVRMKMKALRKFKSMMKPYNMSSRSSTLSNAFAQALAPSDVYNAEHLENAFKEMNLFDENGELLCTYCNGKSSSVDHLNPLVSESKFTGWGHVFGNLVPACASCNQQKGGKPWRDYVAIVGVSKERIGLLEIYEGKAPQPVSQDDLALIYPDLLDAYQRLRELSIDTLRAAQSLANEIRRLEESRKKN